MWHGHVALGVEHLALSIWHLAFGTEVVNFSAMWAKNVHKSFVYVAETGSFGAFCEKFTTSLGMMGIHMTPPR